jgi:threonine/homoserine/homoserine lactone efflux protein
VLLTTLVNPKALVLTYAIMPETGATPKVTAVAEMLLIIAACSVGWIGLGAWVSARLPRLAATGWIERAGAVVLAALAAVVTGNAFGWVG